DLLRCRFERRNMGVAAALGTTLLAGQALAAPVSTTLAQTTARAAVGTGARSAAAAALAGALFTSAGSTRLALAMALLLLVLPLAGGLALLPGLPAEDAPRQPPPPAGAVDNDEKPRTDRFGDPLPEGAVSRLGTLRFNHGNRVLALHVMPDGKKVVSLGDD